MKYRTFTRLRGGVLALVAAGAAFMGCRAVTAPKDATPPSAVANGEGQGNYPTPVEVSVPPSNPSGTTIPQKGNKAKPEATAGSQPIEDWQQEVLKMQKQPLSNGELKSGSYKWVVNGGGMKAEFRSDTDKGAKGWNRVKVDLNQNKKFEERWDFKDDGTIKRRVAPNDDENYTEEWTLKGQTWVRRK